MKNRPNVVSYINPDHKVFGDEIMTPDKWLSLGQTALELGLINALTVLALFLS